MIVPIHVCLMWAVSIAMFALAWYLQYRLWRSKPHARWANLVFWGATVVTVGALVWSSTEAAMGWAFLSDLCGPECSRWRW